MSMHLIDWSILGLLIMLMTFAALSTRRYTKSVADFLAANRCAGRYMLGVAEGIAGVGAITVVANFEAYYQGGFSFAWWQFILFVVMIVVALTGWVVYRFRQTRALTLAQFLETRYSRRFRVFSGVVMFISGILNFAIFPGIGARLFMYLCDIPSCVVFQWGIFEIDLTIMAIMLVLLALALFFTFAGGQIAVMVSDFIQGTFFNIVFCLLLLYLMLNIPWSHVIETVSIRPPGQSLIDPFDSAGIQDFNFTYYLIAAFVLFYTVRAWQGNQGYFVSALNAHEARMGNILGQWRMTTQYQMIFIVPVFAFTLMHHPAWTNISEPAQQQLSAIGSEVIRNQATTPVILREFLPLGLLGAFVATMFAAFISTHTTYLHSWGSIFIQDILLPIRKKPFQPSQHMKYLKRSIFGVAVFIFIFSLIIPIGRAVLMYFAMTGTIWLGGAGAVIVGGLYWKRGTTLGAYCAIIVGIVTAVLTFALPRLWQYYYQQEFMLNAQVMLFIAMMVSTAFYVLVSLLDTDPGYDMDRLLHRGRYAVTADTTQLTAEQTSVFRKLLGIGRDFNFKDQFMYLCLTGFIVLCGVVFIVGTLYGLIFGIETESWATFWFYYVWVVLYISVLTTLWLSLGGLIDLKKMYRRLATCVRNSDDDGTVSPQK